MTEATKEVKLIGKCKKLSIDFCSKNSGQLILSLSNGDDALMSVQMDCDTVKDFITILENPPISSMVELNDGRCEKRDCYRYLNAIRNKEELLNPQIGIGKHNEIIQINMQLNKDRVQVGSITLTKLDVKLLIGVLFIWLGNNFLSSRTVHSMFTKNSLQSDKLNISNIRLPVDC